MHKRSLNFRNEYFDSKVKVFANIEELVRSKIQDIVNCGGNHENTFTAGDLNDSLDYHAENMEEINRIYKVREEVYESSHIPMKKATSKYTQENSDPKKSKSSVSSSRLSPAKNSKLASNANTPKLQKNLILNAPTSPMIKPKIKGATNKPYHEKPSIHVINNSKNT